MNIKSYFRFAKQQRNGIFLLFLLIILLQLGYFFWISNSTAEIKKPNEEWLAMQSVIDSLKNTNENQKTVIYPFNPNFITDYKGYKLGMSVEELDKLFAFRKQNKYVNSAKEFQTVTGVSDSLLKVISPYFKFPDWINQPKKEYISYSNNKVENNKAIVKIDINQATQEDLIKVYGIGPALSERILKNKESLGGFVSMEQMQFIWGLSPEVIENLNKHFVVTLEPKITKIDINNASVKELAKFPYFNYTIAKEIVTHRSMNGEIKDIEDLTKIKGLPNEKIKIIALYLEF
ncbi:helix-hairpin-helix domain-containing protein [Flavobacterium azooxidireducens]|uniref:Helix-hairpin-helix domain-containing protein n=1 Tax=Flavobacterium azooxidireducens TaxID=1871076 RepID=A0ABY4KFW1_9FLAO|nr:helix-hairpin-helix domain-containing protein [Flavobacterium azooxidireducens]UPQ79698.1 helix-hairpin-helix domain-containing protein [Flavobacterium azooxidireducens]